MLGIISLGVGAVAPAHAQVFLADKPSPEFAIGPIFAVATVAPDMGPTTVNLSWSLTSTKPGRLAELVQDLYLLWPSEIDAPTAPGRAEPTLAPYLEARGFQVVQDGRLTLRSRDRSQIGTGALGEPVDVVVSYVTFARASGPAAQAGVATFIKIPRTPKLADPLSVMTLGMPMKSLITPKTATWFEEFFWGRRYVMSLSFNDVGALALPLYPMYFEHRDRVVKLARDFSLLIISFPDSDHLRIDDITPPSATRRPSRVRAGNETVSLVLSGGEGLTPQLLRVEFSYFDGRIAWRPIIISLVFLLLGNVAGAIMLTRDVTSGLRRRLHFGRRPATYRETGTLLKRDTVLALVPGTATRADVLRLCGQPSEEREHWPGDGSHTVIYRGARVTTRRRRGLGWVATIDHREREQHEVIVHLQHDRVRDVEWRVNRTRAERE